MAIIIPMVGRQLRFLLFKIIRESLNRTIVVTSEHFPNGDIFCKTFVLVYALIASNVAWCTLDVFMNIPLLNIMLISPVASASSVIANTDNGNVSNNVASGSSQNPSRTPPLPDSISQPNPQTSTETRPRNDRMQRIGTKNVRGVAAVIKLSSIDST